ncbi:hypothetical protein MKW98_026430 [Papaver atlanticum]|uniref:PGG domain-containing protein n=1 Tax=Papaver atlanticum TaxID=357466 RepID=A0AAD4TCW2_9MAGN|nr:hypothetical protein MKW98_026430 [Papaver atlanticum]
MSATEIGNDRDNYLLHREMTEIKKLLKVVIESQARQMESQEKLAKYHAQQAKAHAQSQENIQNQMLEVLRSIFRASNKQEENIVKNNNAHLKEITKASGSGGAGGGSGEQKHPSKEEKVVRAIYNPDRSDLLKEGDCQETIAFLNNNPETLEQGVTRNSNTVLHVAIYKKREITLIEEIVKLMSPELLEYRGGEYDFTALHYAAQYGNIEAVVLLVNKNPKLPRLLDKRGFTPLDLALRNVSINQKDVVEYLYSVTKDMDPSPFLGGNGAYTLCKLIEANFYDIALSLVRKFPKVAITKSKSLEMCGLEMVVRRPFAFQSGAKLTWWQNLIYPLIQVDTNSTYIEPVEQAECTIRDEENPLSENLDCAEVEASSKVSIPTTYQEIIMSYLTRGYFLERYLNFDFSTGIFKRLYNQKLVHQQTIALMKQMLVEICKLTTLSRFLGDNPNIMKIAIKHGIFEFVAECLKKNDNLIFSTIPGEESMIQLAITERNEMIVDLLCKSGDKLGEKIDLLSRRDADKNTILHYAAKSAPFAQLNLVSGAVLQIQREMQWYKGVESMLRESDRFTRNTKGDTAQFIFTEAHKDLVKEGQDWLKDTSGSCMIVAALIAIVTFASAFTVPGGNISDSNSLMNGTPVFLGKSSFTVFAVSDALALFSSMISVLMFLALYTSRYSELDFLMSLPQKLIIGLATLFISMVAMLVAFGASMFIVVGSIFAQALIPITLFSCCPLGLFAWLQLPLFVEMVRSTYWGSLFPKHKYIDFPAKKNDNESRKMKKEDQLPEEKDVIE